MLYEEPTDQGTTNFFRTAIKSKCTVPITYAVAMFNQDWMLNIEHAYKDFDLVECHDATPVKESGDVEEVDDVTECLIRVTPEKPMTGWQLKPESYGIHWAHKVQLAAANVVKAN